MKVNDATEIDWAKIDVDGFGSRAKRQHLAAIHGLAKIATGNEELSHKSEYRFVSFSRIRRSDASRRRNDQMGLQDVSRHR